MPRAWNRKLVFAVPHHSAACADRALGHAGDLGGRARASTACSTRRPASKPTVCCVDEVAIDPVVLDHQVAARRRRAPRRGPGLTGRIQIARARDRRDARILDDDLRALLARLPDVVRRDRRALGDVRAGDPDHVGADHVGPRVGRAIDAERLLVRGAGADHAEPAVVVDVRRLQADARELAEQVGLLGRQARAAEHADRRRCRASFWMRAISARDVRDRLVVRHRRETRAARVGSRRSAVSSRSGCEPCR